MTDDFTPVRQPQRGLSRGLVLAAGIAVAGAGLWGWYAAHQAGVRIDSLEQRLDGRIAELARSEATLADRDRQLSGTLDVLSSGQAGLNQRVDDLYGSRRSGLLAAEAEHMVRLAMQRLALMQDPAGALTLLAAADDAVNDIRDADTHAVRAALAADSARLRAAAALDVEAVYLRLANLPAQVDQLAQTRGDARPAAAPVRDVAPDMPPATDGTWWNRITATLTTLVTIRRVNERPDPMVTAGERALAAQNFRLLAEQAQIALLQRRAGIYAHSLAQADAWLARLAGGDPGRRNALHRELTSLRAIDLGQPLPELDASLAATRALAARLLPESGGGAK